MSWIQSFYFSRVCLVPSCVCDCTWSQLGAVCVCCAGRPPPKTSFVIVAILSSKTTHLEEEEKEEKEERGRKGLFFIRRWIGEKEGERKKVYIYTYIYAFTLQLATFSFYPLLRISPRALQLPSMALFFPFRVTRGALPSRRKREQEEILCIFFFISIFFTFSSHQYRRNRENYFFPWLIFIDIEK